MAIPTSGLVSFYTMSNTAGDVIYDEIDAYDAIKSAAIPNGQR